MLTPPLCGSVSKFSRMDPVTHWRRARQLTLHDAAKRQEKITDAGVIVIVLVLMGLFTGLVILGYVISAPVID